MEFFKLYNGVEIPANGYGVYQVTKEDCKECVLNALKVGYRHIDTAQAYYNEEEVGDAILDSKIDREKLFITTKVWVDNYKEGVTYNSVIESLKKLKLEYLDLILLHQCINDYHAAYKDLEKLYKEGKVRAIGVSNFFPDRLVDLCNWAEIKPMVNQIEINPFFQNKEAQIWNKKYGVILEAWAPFGEGRKDMFTNPTLSKIGQNHNKSVAQVILRWLYQKGIVSLAKSVRKERIEENFNIYNFSLNQNEIEMIDSLDENASLFLNHRDPKTVEFFYEYSKNFKNNI